MKIPLLTLITITLAACAGPLSTGYSAFRVRGMDDAELCMAYAESAPEIIAKEISERNLISASEQQLIDQHKLEKDMSECAMILSLGGVGPYGKVNELITGIRHYKQYMRRDCDSCTPLYVIVENGRVINWY